MKCQVLKRIGSMLKPGGQFYLRDTIFSFPPAEYKMSIERWIEGAAKPEGEGWTVKDYQMHVREEHSTFAWVVEGMLKQAGFDIIEVNYLSPVTAEYLCKKIASQS